MSDTVRFRVAFDTAVGVMRSVLESGGEGIVIVDGPRAREAFAKDHHILVEEVYDLVHYERLPLPEDGDEGVREDNRATTSTITEGDA